MAIIKSPPKALSAYKSRSRTGNRSPETSVSSALPEKAGPQVLETRSAGAALPRLVRHSSLPSLPPSEHLPSSATNLFQLQQPAAQQGERSLEPQSVKTTQSPFAGLWQGVELLQPRLLGLHHQPQHQEATQQHRDRRAYSEPKTLQMESNSDHINQASQRTHKGQRGPNLKDTDHAPSGQVTPLLRRAQGERLEAARLYHVASQRLKQAKEREEALLFEQDMHILRNYGNSDNSSSGGSVHHSGSEEGLLSVEVIAAHRQSASVETHPHQVENERQKLHESQVFSKRPEQMLLTPRTETPPLVGAAESSRNQDTLKGGKGNAEAQNREGQFDGESSLLAWLEQGRRNIGKAGAYHHHLSSPGIKVKSEEREASHFAALKEERDSGNRLQYKDYYVPIEIPSSVGSESGFGSNTSPQKRWRSPTPLPPKVGLHRSQDSPKLSPPATAGTSREPRRYSSRSLPPRPRPTRSHEPRPRPYPPPPNPPQAPMHSQQSTQTSPQGPQLFSRRFSDRLGSYPAVIFYTHIDHVENYYQQPNERHIHSHDDTDTKGPELSSEDAEQAMEQDDDEVRPRDESPMM